MNFKKVFIIFIITATFTYFPIFNFNKSLGLDDPGNFIIKITKNAIDTLTDQSISQNEKENKFGALFDKNFDVPSISRFVLGKYWKQATLDQKKGFIKAFRNYIVSTYSSRFNEYSGETLKLLNYENESNPKLFLVHTVLEREDALPITVDWRIGQKKDRYVILDIIIEGISLAITQRSEFVSVIDQNEGSIDKLISLLKEKT